MHVDIDNAGLVVCGLRFAVVSLMLGGVLVGDDIVALSWGWRPLVDVVVRRAGGAVYRDERVQHVRVAVDGSSHSAKLLSKT